MDSQFDYYEFEPTEEEFVSKVNEYFPPHPDDMQIASSWFARLREKIGL